MSAASAQPLRRRTTDLATRARDKVKSLREIATISQQAQEQGRTVVLAHGVFDLVHLGHIRHLEAAEREGDVLIVSVTPDRFVNKGPGRPVFGEPLRAEMLAALECVDWVTISDWPSAEELITLVKPNVYIKGPDYSNEGDDITGKIGAERTTVERYGGRVITTEDITFSSSALINRNFNVFDPEVMEYLGGLNQEEFLRTALAAIDGIADMRVLLVGEAIIDEYQYVKPMGKSANHVADFCREVGVITILGERDSYQDLIRDTVRPNVKVHALFRRGVPTTRKCRFVDPGHMRKMFEVYFFEDEPVSGNLEKQLADMIGDKARDFDLVIVTDFGHGMMTDRAIRAVTESAKFLAVNAQSNSANLGYNLITRYSRADYVCIDAPEAQLAMGDRFSDISDLIATELRGAIDCRNFVVTHGERGCVVYSPSTGVRRVPAFTRQVVDTVGAGDAFLAVTSPIVAAGTNMEVAGFIGNAVGALKVGIVGHRQSVEKIPVKKYITTLLK